MLSEQWYCCTLILESDAEIQFHGEKYFQENLIVLLTFFSPFKFTEESVQLEEHLLYPNSLAISSCKCQCYSAWLTSALSIFQ